MKQAKKRLSLLSMLMVIVMVVSVFAGCGAEDESTSGSTVAPSESTAAPSESTAAPSESTAAPSESTTAPSESTTAPSGTAGDDNQEPTAPSGTAGDNNQEPTVPPTGYKFGFLQGTLNQVLYFNGQMSRSYLAMTGNAEEAVDVYVETVTGGYRLYFMDGQTKTYIEVALRSGKTDKADPKLVTEPTCVYTYNEELNIYVTKLGNVEFFLGSYSDYGTISASALSYITDNKAADADETQFLARLYSEENLPTVSQRVEDNAEAILDAANALEEGKVLKGGQYSLTGKVVSIDTPYSKQYNNITITIQITDDEHDRTISCYRLKGTGIEDLAVGDTVTVTGVIRNYKGTIQFIDGCKPTTIISGTPGETPDPNPGDTPEITLPNIEAVPETGYVYEKVNADQDDWTGTYLFVWENGNQIFDTTKNLSDNAANGANVTVVDGKIATGETVNVMRVIIDKVNNQYYIRIATGKFLSRESNLTGFDVNDAIANAGTVTITWEDGAPKIVSEGGAVFRVDTYNSKNRFVFLKTNYLSDSDPVALYKLVEGQIGNEGDGDGDQTPSVPQPAEVSNEAELKAAVEAQKAQIKLTANIALTAHLYINYNVEIDGQNNTVSGYPIHVNAANVTIKNVKFQDADDENDRASFLYVGSVIENLLIDGCSFKDTQWDAVQITPAAGQITINNCSFEQSKAVPEGNKSRFIHIEAAKNSNANVTINLTINTFGASTHIKDALIDIDYINKDSINLGGNNVVVDTEGDIYICGDSAARSMTADEAYPALSGIYRNAPKAGTAYKYGFLQGTLNKVLYFNGTMSGNFLGVTENVADAVDVYVEYVAGGYRLYFMKNETKTYIDVVQREGAGNEHKADVVLTEEPTCVYHWNNKLEIFTVSLETTEFFLGTYSTHDTVSASAIGYITGDNEGKLDTTNFAARLYTADNLPVAPFVKPTTASGIFEEANKLAEGETLQQGPYTLTGLVDSISGDVFTIKVGENTILATGLGNDARQGYRVTVTGQIEKKSGNIQFASGATLDKAEDVTESQNTIVYDFKDLKYGANEITGDTLAEAFEKATSDTQLVSVTGSKVYAGSANSGVFGNKNGYLKLGTGSKNGEIILTYGSGVKVAKVEIWCHAWTTSSNDKVSVNSSANQNASTTGTCECLTFELDSQTNAVTIKTSKRAFISKIVITLA